jgi:hypothetical protein
MHRSDELERLVALERSVWQALKEGDAAADARLLSEHFCGVYDTGIADKSAHVAQLRNGPTVSCYELSNPTALVLAEGVVALSYLARWRRASSPVDSALESMYVTSIWRVEGGSWLNVFSQDTNAAVSAL